MRACFWRRGYSLTDRAGVRSTLDTGTNLTGWSAVPGLPLASGVPLEIPLDGPQPHRFYRIGAGEHLDADADGLLDFEERVYYGTAPLVSDTDGDGVGDGEEVRRYGSDPLFASPTGPGRPSRSSGLG